MQWIRNIFKKCEKSRAIDITKLYQEYEWVRKVLNSCTTQRQLCNAQNLVDIWYEKEIRKLYSLDISDIDIWDAEHRLDKLYDNLGRIFLEKMHENTLQKLNTSKNE